jgi:hypothetical protein
MITGVSNYLWRLFTPYKTIATSHDNNIKS